MEIDKEIHLSGGEWTPIPDNMLVFTCCQCGLTHVIAIREGTAGMEIQFTPYEADEKD